jgi:hypothetical protein
MITVNVVPPGTVGLSEENIAGNVVAYPNPNNGHFSLQMNGSTATTIIEVMSMTGQKVYRSEMPVTGPVITDFDLSHLENGFYFVKVTQGVRTATLKISIQK